MGEVYRAHDTTLSRDVALKILPASVTHDPDRVARFRREAQVLASLNHPHIGAIYGFDEAPGLQFLILELVDGETLADRIRRGRLPLDEAVRIASEVVEALDAAHEKGIIHRDLKPANIALTSDGHVKVLDFGLAKALESPAPADAASSPTMTSPALLTRAGVILGTAAYMSPEQTRGQPVDRRSDIWGFGCVLYEMLAGRAAFAGDTVSDTIAIILERDPDWAALPSHLPAGLRRLLARCLDKNPKERLRDIADARFDLRGAVTARVVDANSAGRAAPTHGGGWWAAAAGAIVGALIAAAAVGLWRRQPVEAAVPNPLSSATFTRLTDFEGAENDAAISPDGKWVAFLSDRDGVFDAWVGQVGAARFTNLTQGREDTTGGVRMIGFSGDGSDIWLGGQSPNRRLRLVPLMGGASRVFLREHVINVAWSPDGRQLVYHTLDAGDPMFVADRDGASPRQIFINPIAGGHNHFPMWSADGRWIYFASGLWTTTEMDLWRVPASGGAPERLTNHRNNVTYPTPLDARTVLYVAPAEDGSGPWLWALDPERRTTQRISFGLEKYVSIAASADGHRLVATVANPSANLWTIPIAERPVEDAELRPFSLPTVRAFAPRFGGGALFYLSSHGTGDGLWKFADGQAMEIWKGANGTLLEPPAVSPDGKRVAILLRRDGKTRLHLVSADGAELTPLTDGFQAAGAASWSPDGAWIVVGGTDSRGPGLFKIPPDGGAPVRILAGPALNPVWSPEGGLIAFTGGLTGNFSPLLAVRPDGTPVELPRIQLRNQGERYRFLPSGKGLVYMQGGRPAQDFWLLDVTTRKTRQLSHTTNGTTMRSFDITPDGTHIVFDRLRENSDVVLIERPK